MTARYNDFNAIVVLYSYDRRFSRLKARVCFDENPPDSKGGVMDFFCAYTGGKK